MKIGRSKICIDQNHLFPTQRQSHGKIGANKALANTAFASTNSKMFSGEPIFYRTIRNESENRFYLF